MRAAVLDNPRTMPEESTPRDLDEAFRRSFQALNRGDFDEAVSLWAPDAVYTLASGGFAILEGNVIRGRDALRRLWEDLTLAFDSFEFVTEALDDLGHSVVFGAFAMRGKPHGGGSAVEIRFGTVSIWRDRQIASATNYTDVAEARAAAERLAEERATQDSEE